MNEEKKEALRKEFSAILDNELDPETRATLEAELAEDAELLRELDLLKKVDALYQNLPRHNAPDDFEARVHAALETNVVPLSRFQKFIRWGTPPLALAATLMIVSAIYFSMEKSLPGEKFNLTKAPQEETTLTPDAAARPESAPLPAAVPPQRKQKTDMPIPNALPAAPVDDNTASMISQSEQRMEMEEAYKARDNSLGRAEENKNIAGKESSQNAPAFGDGRIPEENPPAPVIPYEPEPEPDPEPAPMPRPMPAPKPEPKAEPMPESPKILLESSHNAPGNFTPHAPKASSIGYSAGSNMRRDADESDIAGLPTGEMIEGGEKKTLASNESALMKDEKSADAEQEAQLDFPVTHFQKLRKYLKETAEVRERIEIEDARIAGGKQFNLAQSVWVEATYQDEDPEYLEKGSRALKKLQKKHSELAEIIGLGNFILVKFDTTWYFIYDLGVAPEE
jgi:hypothetical protein